MGRKNLKNRLFGLFILIGTVPLILVLIINGLNRISDLEENARSDMWTKTIAVDNHVTDLLSMNLHVLHAVALMPTMRDYISAPAKEKETVVIQTMTETNRIFGDSNTMALTGADGKQLIRTDQAPLVDIIDREHFQQTMKGKDYVSNAMLSRATGKDIIVLGVPVRDDQYKTVGMVQRNFSVEGYQIFVNTLSDDKASIILMDREGKILAHSNRRLLNESERDDPIPYQFVTQAMAGVFGVVRIDVDGVDCLVSYKKNPLTGWPVIIVQPYRYIFQEANKEVMGLALLGIISIFLVSVAAYRFSGETAKPIQNILHTAKQITKEATHAEQSAVSTDDDEMQEIAEAFNELRAARDAYRQETERDTLTGLYSKDAVEAICRKKLDAFRRMEQNYDFIVFYVIDLDHFKELNETQGRLYGDRVLLEFAQRLRKIFRPLDCVGRLENDEFIAVVDYMTDLEEILQKAGHINRIARSLVLDEQTVPLTASVGIAFSPQDGTSYDTVLHAARKALSKAKLEGSDGFHYFASDEGI